MQIPRAVFEELTRNIIVFYPTVYLIVFTVYDLIIPLMNLYRLQYPNSNDDMLPWCLYIRNLINKIINQHLDSY